MIKLISYLIIASSLIDSLNFNHIDAYDDKCPANCEFGVNFFNNDHTWTCKCAKDICEELDCVENSACKIKYRQKCINNSCTRSKTVYCQSIKKDGLCPSSQANLNSTKSCTQDVDCPDYDKCCPTSNGENVCVKPCFKPKCSCKQTFVIQYTTNARGCPTCHCVKRKLEKTQICSLPREIGPCRAAHSRYFYNNISKQCERFIYGGCHGNENNFLSMNECESACMPPKMIKKDETKKCLLNKEAGPCEAEFTRFYYDSELKSCESFIYGGCKGNENNFDSKENCEKQCAEPLKTRELTANKCQLDKETGPCYARLERYFFNKVTKKCEKFVYGGCQGNANNFETLEECKKECSINGRSSKVNKCELNSDGGMCRGYIERFFYNKNTGKCETFIYGGCEGNENNFNTLEECVKDCAQSSVGVPILKETQNKVCDLDLDIGPCRAYFEKYYYNKQTKKCEPFGWGGCKGNSNKFNSIEECERECVSETKDKETQKNTEIQSEDSNLTDEKVLNKPSSEICQLKKDTGNCKAYISKFYFNSSTKRCESFIWSGCGGNENNFSSEEECNQVCCNQQEEKSD